MRVFHTLIYDDTVEGTNAVYTSPDDNALLGTADALSIFGYAAQAGGTSPTLTVQVEQGPDERRWANRNGTAEVNAASLSGSAETTFSGNDGNPAGSVRLGFVRIRVQLGGTLPKAKVKIWVTGRGEQGGLASDLGEEGITDFGLERIRTRGIGPERARGSTNGIAGIAALTQTNREGSR